MTVHDLIGKEYEEVGRCWGLAVKVCSRRGLYLPPTPEAALAEAKALGQTVEVPDDGTLVIMHNSQNDEHHVGVMLDRRYIMHATREFGVRVELLQNVGPHLSIRRYVQLEPARDQETTQA